MNFVVVVVVVVSLLAVPKGLFAPVDCNTGRTFWHSSVSRRTNPPQFWLRMVVDDSS